MYTTQAIALFMFAEKPTQCISDRFEAILTSQTYVPQCDEKGNFAMKQCASSEVVGTGEFLVSDTIPKVQGFLTFVELTLVSRCVYLHLWRLL